jgi:hypothetical protein
MPTTRKGPRGKWGEVYDAATRADAEEWVAKHRAEDKAENLNVRYSIREQRRQHWYYTREGETRYIVYMLAEGVY